MKFFFIKFSAFIKACFKVSADVDASLENFFGLKNGTSAPNFLEIDAIFFVSVNNKVC